MGIVKNLLYKFSGCLKLETFKKQSIFPYYHLVSDDVLPHIKNLYPYKSKSQFIHDIALLSQKYKSLSPSALQSGSIPQNSCLLTFDDGLKEVYTEIYPILKERNMSAIFFINPDFIDNKKGFYKHYISLVLYELEKRGFIKSELDAIADLFHFEYHSVLEFKSKFLKINRTEEHKLHVVFNNLGIDIKKYLAVNQPYLSKDQIKEMISNGFYFGGHTMTHPYLNTLSHEEQLQEILESVTWMKRNFNLEYSFFAFPFTDKNVSKKLVLELLNSDKELILFGNSGLKKDIDNRIFQRFSLENPQKDTHKAIITENLYKLFNKLVGKYNIKRE